MNQRIKVIGVSLQNLSKMLAVIFLLMTPSIGSTSALYLSSYDAENGLSNFSGGIQQGGFHGIRFTISETIHVSGLSAYIGGSGDFFAAIVGLDSAADLPSLVTPEQVAAGALAYNTGTFQTGGAYAPSKHEVILNVVLGAGSYVALFGAPGELFEENSGLIPIAAESSLSNIDLNDYVIMSWNQWISAPGEPVSMQVYASVVPVPPAVWLFGSALAGLGWLRRR